MKKEITNFLPRLRGKRWPVMALAWMALAGGTAWGQQSSIVWEGEDYLPREVNFTSIIKEGEVSL
jgi:hypothetical protein